MPHSPDPLHELRDNLTGAAAGDYTRRIKGDNVVDTQSPLDSDVSPLDRQGDGDARAGVREEDADGAPEL